MIHFCAFQGIGKSISFLIRLLPPCYNDYDQRALKKLPRWENEQNVEPETTQD
jgi:hypothetical protein